MSNKKLNIIIGLLILINNPQYFWTLSIRFIDGSELKREYLSYRECKLNMGLINEFMDEDTITIEKCDRT